MVRLYAAGCGKYAAKSESRRGRSELSGWRPLQPEVGRIDLMSDNLPEGVSLQKLDSDAFIAEIDTISSIH
jgi:hypothetical protein